MACLGRQSQARNSSESKRRSALSKHVHGPAGDRTVTLAMPIKNTLPAWGKSVGGVSERAGVKAGGSNPFARHTIPSRVVTVKGILAFWKAALFAECRRNEGLGRSVSELRYPPPHASAPMTADVRRQPRRGTSSAYAKNAYAPGAGTRDRRMHSGTRPSLGPSTRAR